MNTNTKGECLFSTSKALKTCRGRILWFNLRRGTGCIVREDGKGDCFFHSEAMRGSLHYFQSGERVEFDLVETKSGLRAANVKMVTDRDHKAIGERKDKPPSLFRGHVKWFSLGKGYGFITCEDGQEYFVHHSGIAGPIRYLRDGEFVEFQLKRTERGIQAVHVCSLGKKVAAS